VRPQPNHSPKQEQKPAPAQQPSDQSDQETAVRISTQLVQIDATVTDKKGEHVEDLTEDDFTLTVDGKKQPITYFTLVKLPEPKRAGGATNAPKSTPAPPTAPAKVIAPSSATPQPGGSAPPVSSFGRLPDAPGRQRRARQTEIFARRAVDGFQREMRLRPGRFCLPSRRKMWGRKMEAKLTGLIFLPGIFLLPITPIKTCQLFELSRPAIADRRRKS
jgi:hypothetical protein